jgi:hypothetical protein
LGSNTSDIWVHSCVSAWCSCYRMTNPSWDYQESSSTAREYDDRDCCVSKWSSPWYVLIYHQT